MNILEVIKLQQYNMKLYNATQRAVDDITTSEINIYMSMYLYSQ